MGGKKVDSAGFSRSIAVKGKPEIAEEYMVKEGLGTHYVLTGTSIGKGKLI